jgi:hypothetical protein
MDTDGRVFLRTSARHPTYVALPSESPSARVKTKAGRESSGNGSQNASSICECRQQHDEGIYVLGRSEEESPCAYFP